MFLKRQFSSSLSLYSFNYYLWIDVEFVDFAVCYLPDILECEVKWPLGRITMNKASGGDGIPVNYFKS